MNSRPNLSDLDQRVGDQLVRLVQIVFALVVTQSLVLYRNVVIAPFSGRYYLAALALLNVYVMTVYSWVDWHRTVAIYPYNLSFYGGRRIAELLKLAIDLAIVTLYAYVLFTVDVVRASADASIAKYLWGFVLIYSMYLGLSTN